MESRQLVIAHRGASGYRPEHTRAAYELAIRQGADAVEPDLVATRDGVLVIRHENEISTTTDVAAHPEFAGKRTTKVIDGQELAGWFTEDFTWSELRTIRARERLPGIRPRNARFRDAPILCFADLLDLLATTGSRTGLVVELKHATYSESVGLPLDELVAQELDVADWQDKPRPIVESFELTVLEKLAARGFGARLVFLVEALGAPADQVAVHGTGAPTYLDYLSPSALSRLAQTVDGISVSKQLLLDTDPMGNVTGTSDLARRAHDASLRIFGWTLRAENVFLAPNLRRGRVAASFGDWEREFRLILESGVDGVFADQPDLAMRIRDEQ